MKLFSVVPVLILLTFMTFSEVVSPVKEIAPRKTYEYTGMAPTATPYQFPQIVTPAPTPTIEPTPTAIPEVWQFVGEGIATYYAAGWNCWTSIISAQIRNGWLPRDFQGNESCYYAATIDRSLFGKTLRVTNLSDGRRIEVQQVDAVATHDIPAFLRKGAVIDISYAAASAVGFNSVVLVEVKE